MQQTNIKEAFRRSRYVLYFLYTLSIVSVFVILLLITKWIGEGLPTFDSVNVMMTMASLSVLVCASIGLISIRNMETKLKSLESVFLSE